MAVTMNIVVLDGHTLAADDNPFTPLEPYGEVVVYPISTPPEALARSRDADILVVNKTRVTAEILAHSPRLKFIAVLATGYDCVDIAAAKARGIPVSNVPEYGTDSVAQFVFAQLLYLCHRVGLHDAAVRAGEWAQAGEFSFWKSPLVELVGKTMGIIGFGRIGRRVGELAHAFGMPVLAYDTYHGTTPSYQPFAWAELDDLVRQSDVITLHSPLTSQTAGMVNRDFLSKCKPTAFLLNAARGPLIAEADLAGALNHGRLAGAAVDVVSQEPIKPNNPLLKARNCLITPHIAWATLAARKRLMATTAANIASFLAGNPTNVVNG
jgi:glycerate dehydrogenase